MEDHTTLIEPLFERLEAYGKTSYELFRLKTIDKVAGVISSLVSRSIAIIILTMFIIIVNIGIALWLGDLLGKLYYGFFCVAGIYGLAAIIIFAMHDSIKKSIGNSIISKMLN